MKIYVEGGGDTNLLKTACRQGFSEFLKKAGFTGHMPRIVACGGRQDAYDAFSTAMAKREPAILLVDSESPVAADCQQGEADTWLPWHHLRNRQGDQWEKPVNATDTDCHLMVQCMEAWLLADRDTLQTFFGQGFNANSLPAAGNPIESVAKEQIYRSLADATRNCKTKAPYGKGEHSFKLLALVAPDHVTAASPWARRFVAVAKTKMGC